MQTFKSFSSFKFSRALATAFIVIAASALAVTGCGKKDSKAPVATAPTSAGLVYVLTADESCSCLTPKKLTVRLPDAKSHTVMFRVAVPKSDKQQHGIGLDGGAYKALKGAPVRPGLSTGISIEVKRGVIYKIYDAYKKNRSKGYVATATVE